MTIALWTLVVALMAAGVVGTVLPVLPGARADLRRRGARRVDRRLDPRVGWTLGVLGVLALVSIACDFVAASLGAKRLGASPLAVSGAAVGTLAGVFTGLWGVLFMPFVGAAIGEFVAMRNLQRAGRVGIATGVGLLVGVVVKLALAFSMIGIFVAALVLSERRETDAARQPISRPSMIALLAPFRDQRVERVHAGRVRLAVESGAAAVTELAFVVVVAGRARFEKPRGDDGEAADFGDPRRFRFDGRLRVPRAALHRFGDDVRDVLRLIVEHRRQVHRAAVLREPHQKTVGESVARKSVQRLHAGGPVVAQAHAVLADRVVAGAPRPRGADLEAGREDDAVDVVFDAVGDDARRA